MVGRRGLAAAAALLLAACRGDARTDHVVVAATQLTGLTTECVARYDALRTDLDAAHRLDLAAALVAACRLDGVAPSVLQTQPTRATADVVLRAAGGACTPTARDRFLARFEGTEPTSNAPWRQLAADCPTVVGIDGTSERFMSLTWFWLTQVARAMSPSTAPLDVPLPAWGITGAGFTLPTSDTPLVFGLERHITVTPEATYAGELPWARLRPDADKLDVIRGADYPGRPLTPAAITAFIGASSSEPIAILAPLKLPARRVVDVLVGRPAPAASKILLAIQHGDGFGGLPVDLAGAARTGDPWIDLGNNTRRTWLATRAAAPACRLDDARWSLDALGATLRDLGHHGTRRVALSVEVETTVADLAAILDLAIQAGLDEVALVPADTDASIHPPCPPTP